MDQITLLDVWLHVLNSLVYILLVKSEWILRERFFALNAGYKINIFLCTSMYLFGKWLPIFQTSK